MALLTALRQATVEDHRHLETQYWLQRLMSPALSLQDYGCILQAFTAWYAAIEDALMPALIQQEVVLGAYRYRTRLPLLRADLQALGLSPPRQVQAQWHFSPKSLPGVLYVLEGASLGGRVIARHVGEILSLERDQGLRFFLLDEGGRTYDNGPVSNSGWAALQRWLATLSARDTEQASDAARAVFNDLHRHLEQWPVK